MIKPSRPSLRHRRRRRRLYPVLSRHRRPRHDLLPATSGETLWLIKLKHKEHDVSERTTFEVQVLEKLNKKTTVKRCNVVIIIIISFVP